MTPRAAQIAALPFAPVPADGGNFSVRAFAAVMEQVDDLVCVCNPDGVIRYVNPAFERRTGYAAAEVIGKTPAILKSGRHDAAFYGRLWATLGRGEAFSDVFLNRKKSGELYYEAKTLSVLRDPRGTVVHYVSTGKDVTERFLAEQKMERLARARSVIAGCSHVLMHASDETTMLEEMCRIVVELGGHRSAWIGFAEHDEHRTVKPVASAGIELAQAQALKLSWADAPGGRGAVGIALRTRRPKVIDDYFAPSSDPVWHRFALSYGFQSALALPLQVDEGRTGVLMIYSPEVRRFDAEEIALLEEFARDLAFGIRSLRARQLQREAESALRESENLFGEFAANTPGIYWLRDLKSERNLYVSPAWAQITGQAAPFDRDALLSIVHPDDIDRVRADAQDHPCGGIDHEYRIVRPDGSLRWLHMKTFPVRDGNGEVYRVAGVGEDITDRKLRETELAVKSGILHATLENVTHGMTLVDRELRLVAWNQRFLELFKFPEALCRQGTTFAEFIRFNARRGDYGPGDLEEQVRVRVENARRHEPHCFERVDADGSVLEIRRTPLTDGGFVTTYSDITDRKRAELALKDSEQALLQLTSNIPQAYWIQDAGNDRLLYLSPAFLRITGWGLERRDVDAQHLVDIVAAEDYRTVATAANAAPRGGFDRQYRIVRPDGTRRWVRTRTFPVKDASGAVYRIAGVMEDISEQKAAEDNLTQAALYDTLTNLPNRTLFYQGVQQTVMHATANGRSGAVLFLDLDRFKHVNDTLGHAAGDNLLREVATRLVRAIRARDTLGRLGGDEFGILLPYLESADGAATVAEKILTSLAKPFLLEGQEVFVSASIGIAMFPADGKDPDLLIQAADTAMFKAKKAGRNTYRFYTAEMNARALDRLKLESRLRRAIGRREFLLHYQPKVGAADSRLCGAEALLRWNSPESGLVSPADFIPLLEETGLIVSVGEWVIGEVGRQLRAWQDAGLAPVPVAINVSARQFAHGDFAEMVRRSSVAAGIEPQLLELELTESTLMSHAEDTVGILRTLKQTGVALSVDDFGTGYSSLAYLKRFPLDTLKIDRSFIRDATTNSNDAAIVKAIIRMAHELDLKVVAEGVETQAQLEFLRRRGCDEIQGYLFSKPLGADAFADYLRAGAPLEVNHGTA